MDPETRVRWVVPLSGSRELRAARRYDRALSLVMFDLDHCKRINDRHGHVCGDAILTAAAATAGAGLRDALARQTIDWGGEALTVTANFGATSLLASDRDVDPLLERADRALYEAKGASRNRIVYLDE
ncbi:MAG: diguanylate cyclase [Halofilum sp. (in: g-proteobacteria)]